VRTHQHLSGATPAEAWDGIDPHLTRFKHEYWFEAWAGCLYLRRTGLGSGINTADLFVLLLMSRMSSRYAKHFLKT
jgi:hypothetical protein